MRIWFEKTRWKGIYQRILKSKIWSKIKSGYTFAIVIGIEPCYLKFSTTYRDCHTNLSQLSKPINTTHPSSQWIHGLMSCLNFLAFNFLPTYYYITKHYASMQAVARHTENVFQTPHLMKTHRVFCHSKPNVKIAYLVVPLYSNNASKTLMIKINVFCFQDKWSLLIC